MDPYGPTPPPPRKADRCMWWKNIGVVGGGIEYMYEYGVGMWPGYGYGVGYGVWVCGGGGGGDIGVPYWGRGTMGVCVVEVWSGVGW